MPVHWEVDHATRTVLAAAAGELCLGDIEEYLDGMSRAATLSYRKLFDLSGCSSLLSKKELLAWADRVNSFQSDIVIGPVAIVAVSEDAYDQARLFETLTAPRRRLRIFRDVEVAREWLNAEAVKASSSFSAAGDQEAA